ncbi:hypothetical protein ACFVU3_00615 [Streptomyces sp. NPDC058052]|uniref:hypothetical protein n=1 Tax=Streptomyces sp. NPDC058052 TaxID=3346316 RepID=UPI0036E6B6EE
MTELATREAAPVAVPANQTVDSSLEKWAREAAAISGIAQAIASTTLAGAYRGKRDEIVAVILAGHELGLQPMTSLKSIDVIQGQPALRAHAMRGIVQAQGHEVELVESTDTYCKMRGRRRGAEAWQYTEWDIPRAQRLGLLGKDQWKKQPKTMLVARATGELCRLIASDALHGMPYVAEELEGTVHAEVVPPQAPLSIAAVTGPATLPVAPAPAEAEYAVTREDTDDTVWEDVEGSTDWPETAQPGGGE